MIRSIMKNSFAKEQVQDLHPSYHFITNWQLAGATCPEVYRILKEVEKLDDWWPSVYLDVKILEKGQPGPTWPHNWLNNKCL